MPIALLGQQVFNLTGNSDIFNPAVTLTGSRMADFASDGLNQRLLNFRNASGEVLATAGLLLNGQPNNLNNYWSTAGLADGGVVVTGSSPVGTPAFRIFNADGSERTAGATEFAGGQFYNASNQTASQVVALPNGGFFIAFTSATDAVVIDPLIVPANGSPPTGTGVDIRGRFFDATGNAVVNAVTGTTAEFIVTQGFVSLPLYGFESRAGNQSLIDLDVLANGTVVVTERGERFGPTGAAYAYTNIREVTAAGGQVLGQTPYYQVTIGTTEENQGTGQTVLLSNGTVLGLFFPSVQPVGRPSYGALTMQPLNAGGAVIGPSVDLGLNFWNNGNQNYFRALPTNDDGFVIVFSDYSDGNPNRNPGAPNYDPAGAIGSNSDLYLRHYNTNGVLVSQLQITSAAGLDILRSFSAGPDGSYLVSWYNTLGQNLVEQRFVITAGASLSQTGDGTSNTIVVNEGNDWADGEGGADTLYGQGGFDRLYGDAGDDYINGGDGNDTLNGGTGNDILDGGPGADTIEGGTGFDFASYSSSTIALVVDLQFAASQNTGEAAGDSYISIDGLAGSELGDNLRGDGNDNTLFGNGGDDYLFGRDGKDLLQGGAGNDVLLGEAGDDSLYGGADGDSLNGGTGSDSLSGGDGNDSVDGQDGNDFLIGDAGADTLNGGLGNDLVYGGDGVDQLIGDAGLDTLSGDAGDDAIYGQADNDLLYGGDGQDTMNGGTGADAIYGEDGNDVVVGDFESDTLVGGLGNDLIYGQDDNDLLVGGAGNDTLSGGLGNDTLYGQDGADAMYGDDDRDALAGGIGDDTMVGGAGQDSLYGEDGADLLTGDAGDDVLAGGASGDTIYGGDGTDLVFADVGNDLTYGGIGNDTLYGQDGDDTVYGEAGLDTLGGGAGNDVLFGGDNVDLVLGEAGNDVLYGGTGQDTLIGGAGADAFYFGNANEGADFLFDFNQSEGDTIHLQGSGFGIGAGSQVFQGVNFFYGPGVTPATTFATLYMDTNTNALWFDADGTGAGGASVVTFIAGSPLLTASDIVFV